MTVCKLLTVLVLLHNTGVSISIIGGRNAEKGSWPWMVHLNLSTSDGQTKWRCGGTLLNQRWVLTAAHCLDVLLGPDEYRSSVWLGSHELQRHSARYMMVLYFIRHPDYRALSHGYVNDIALIKLKKEVKYSEHVRPVSLPRAGDTFDSSSECWITGWGQVGNSVPLRDPEPLQQLEIPIIPQSNCEVAYSRVLLAGDMAGGKDACKGDDGGPLMCRASRGFVQVGIMSYGSSDGCGLPGRPGIYTQVSRYLRFIIDYTHQDTGAHTFIPCLP